MSSFKKRKLDAVGKSPNGITLQWDEDDYLDEIKKEKKKIKKKMSPIHLINDKDGWIESRKIKKGGKNTMKVKVKKKGTLRRNKRLH